MQSQIKQLIEWEEVFSDAALREILDHLPLADLIESWDLLSDDHKLQIFRALDIETKVDLINELSSNEQEAIIAALSKTSIRNLMDEMEPDDIVDFVQSVSPEIRKAVWEELSDEAKKETLFLLRFDEDDAAGIMTPRYLALRSNLNVGQALAFLRQNIEDVESIYYIYIVDQLQRISGVVSLKQILSSADKEKISDLMETDVISVHQDMDQEEVAKTLETYNLASLPVVDDFHRLLGVITFDDVIDVIREEQTEDVYKMSALSGSAERYLDTSVWKQVAKRVPWLIILLLLGTITTNVLNHYEEIILGASFLFIFMPVITQTGGNTGSQSSTLMIRGLATGEIHFRDTWKILGKEILTALIIGVITGTVILVRSVFLPPGIGYWEALTVGLALAFVVVFATLVGALAPLLIHKMGMDPTVMSAPLMSTVIDVMGLTIYFEIARFMLHLSSGATGM